MVGPQNIDLFITFITKMVMIGPAIHAAVLSILSLFILLLYSFTILSSLSLVMLSRFSSIKSFKCFIVYPSPGHCP